MRREASARMRGYAFASRLFDKILVSRCVNLPLLVHCLFLVPNIVCVCVWSLFLWCRSLCPFFLGNHLAEEERARDFTLIVFLQSCGYL